MVYGFGSFLFLIFWLVGLAVIAFALYWVIRLAIRHEHRRIEISKIP